MTATISAWKDTPTHTLDVGGTSFAYRQLGPRGGTPLVFLHHLTAVLDDWDPRVIDPIAEQRHVITFDNRGIGASGGKVPHTIAAMAADAAAFIRALGHDHVDLLGFSLGGGCRARGHPAEPGPGPAADSRPAPGIAAAGGLTKMPLIVGSAYSKAALTRLDPRQFLFFNRNAVGKQAGTEYIARLRERTADRDKPISHQARIAQLLAIRESRPRRAARPVADHPADVRGQRRQRRHGRLQPVPRAGRTDTEQQARDLSGLRARRHLPVPRAVRPRGLGVPRR